MNLFRYGSAIVALVLLFSVFVYHKSAVHKADRAGYRRATDEMAEKVSKANAATAALEQQSRNRIHEVESAHQQSLSELDARYAAARIPVVRLCPKPAGGGRLPAVAAPATIYHGAAGRDGLPEPIIENIGPDLERLVRLADIQTQRLIACQSFIGTHYITVPR